MKPMRRSLVPFVLLAWSIPVACGGSSSGSGSAGSGGASGAGGGGGGACPASPPSGGATCTAPWGGSGGFGSPSAHCSWGDDPRADCRTTAVCTNGAWKVHAPDTTTCSTPPLPGACPGQHPANETDCSDSTLGCWYDDGTHCWCSQCQGGSGYPSCQIIDPPKWYCAAPKTGCPTTLPQAGTPCSTPGTDCSPSCDLQVTCQDGVWQWLSSSCPVCAAPDTPIATPNGERPISELRVGDRVYSVDHSAVVVVPLLEVGHTRVHAHHVMRVVLANGRVLEVSPGHPTADGRTFGELRPGQQLDETHAVSSAELVPYRFDATYDILPASSTGTYFAAGAEIGSTLLRR